MSARDSDTPLLHWLAQMNATQPWAAAVAQLLLESRADASATNNAGKTPAECVPESDDENSDDEDGEGGSGARDGELYALLLASEQA